MAPKDRFNYPDRDLINPRGRNGMSTRAAYYQRSLYKDKIYPDSFPSPVDVWYDKFLYGRVDRFQNSVVPATQNLKMIPSAAGMNMLALNAVVDVFEKFSNHMAKAVLVSAVDPNGNPRLLDVKAVKAYESPNARYAQFTQGIFDVFLKNINGREKSEIIDFNSFLKFYRRYLLSIAAVTPVTKTNYLISKNGSVFTSGTSIAVANEDAGSDSVKYEKFITDPNFEFFRKCAKKFGFVIDKNAPWVLTADMFSTAFEQAALANYATADGQAITRHNFFDVFFNKTYLTDFADLTLLFINSYISFVNMEPYYDDEGAGANDRGLPGATVERISSGCPITSKLRQPLVLVAGSTDFVSDATPPADMRARFTAASALSDEFLIDLYIDLRQAELGGPISPHKAASLKQQAYEIHQLQPNPELTRLQNVAEFVNRVFRNYIYDVGAVALQERNAKVLDNRVSGGKILVKKGSSRQLY